MRTWAEDRELLARRAGRFLEIETGCLEAILTWRRRRAGCLSSIVTILLKWMRTDFIGDTEKLLGETEMACLRHDKIFTTESYGMTHLR